MYIISIKLLLYFCTCYTLIEIKPSFVWFHSVVKEVDPTKQAQREARKEEARLRSEERRKQRELKKKEGARKKKSWKKISYYLF